MTFSRGLAILKEFNLSSLTLENYENVKAIFSKQSFEVPVATQIVI